MIKNRFLKIMLNKESSSLYRSSNLMIKHSSLRIGPQINIYNHKYRNKIFPNLNRLPQQKIATNTILLWRIFIIK